MKKIGTGIFLFFSLYFPASSQVNLSQGLVAHYPFNGNANDLSGNAINGTLNNVTLTSDRAGSSNNAYYFSSTNSFIELPYSNLYNFAPSGSFTISVWVLPDQGYSWPAQAVVVKSPPNPNYLASQWNYGTYLLNYKAMGGYGGNHVLNGTTTLNSTTCWYNIVQTYDNGRWNMYVNGVLESSDLSQTRFILQDGFSKIVFGKKGQSDGDYFKGKMDDIRIYNRVVTSDEIVALYNENNPCITTNCSNWLLTPSYPSSVSVGDLDVIGNQLTVEALVMSTSNINPSLDWGKIVSKHTGPENVNYSLMANTCEITTTNGYINTPLVCAPVNDKLYHVAMVYDGSILKFYRNGFLMSSVPWTGNLVNNDLLTTIASGPNNPGSIYQQLGFINEVRIWNVARTQSQIRAYINTSIPNPTTQIGLLGYYTFDNLLNKQGNASFNGTINGAASINNTITDCTVKIDSCEIPTSTSIVINKYTPALAFDICKNELTVEDATEFKVGDTVLLMQMKGAAIDSSNTSNFGSVTDYKGAGNYEYNYISSITGNIISLKNQLLRTYEIPNGFVQLIRVPTFTNYTNNEELTCLPWDGKKGGVLAFIVQNQFIINQNLDVSGKGFRGGTSINSQLLNWQPFCQSSDYFYASTNTQSQGKGEGISILSNQKMSGRGRLANGGGGGNLTNSGGGGGSNASNGGQGGNQYQECTVNSFQNGGIPGFQMNYSSTQNKLFMGGGGGAGDANDPNGTASFNANGGNGGGIILVSAGQIINNGFSINANGNDGQFCPFNCNEGTGGGGAGGTVFINCNNINSPIVININGGKGANNTSAVSGSTLYNHGPGGGGSGGVAIFNQSALPANVTVSNSGGLNGISLNSNNSWGAQPGNNGTNRFNYSLPISNTLFTKNITSILTQATYTGCNTYAFTGNAITNFTPVVSWFWNFGNNNTSTAQNISQTFTPPNNFDVKLIGTDVNGCKDSTSITVQTFALPTTATVTAIQPTCTVATGSISIANPTGSNLEYSINGTTYQLSNQFTGIAPGNYNVTVRSTTSGCVSQGVPAIIQNAPPLPASPSINTNQPTCQQSTGSVTITSPIGASFEYSLNNGAFQTAASFTSLTPGNYQVRVRNTSTSCISLPTSIVVNPIPTPPSTPVINNIIQPTCTLPTGSLTIASPAGTTILYSTDGINFQSSVNFTGLQPGNYNLTAVNSVTNCSSSILPFTINPIPLAPATPLVTVLQQPSCTTPNGSFLITSPAGINFEFSRGNNIYQSSSLFNNLDTGLYAVTVRDRLNGCISAPASILIRPDISIPGTFFIPNAFTPNNDGLNDCFGVKNWGVISQFKLMVYNRWGEEVFYTSNPNQCWDGTFKGIAATPDTYVFYIKAVTLCGVVERKGNLVLIR